MSLPDLLSTNPSSLSQQLKARIDQRLTIILRSNYKTQFAQLAPELTAFRDATNGLVDVMDDPTLCETFRNTAPLTTYDAYLPFISKFLKSPCRKSDVVDSAQQTAYNGSSPLISKFFHNPCRESELVDLLAPGLPHYITLSSSTSGGTPKAFPKYNFLTTFDLSAVKPSAHRDTPKRTTAFIFSFLRESLDIVDENDHLIKTVYVTFTSSSVVWRSLLGLPPDKDEEKMALFLSDFAAPYAASFVKKWKSFLIIHGLFALSSKFLERMSMSFVTTFVELIRYIDAEFDTVVDCIANGTIPDVDGIAHVRHYLESSTSPDPERAEELRNIGRPLSHPGWCSLAWPNLRSVTCTASGSFASSLSLAESLLGPNAKILSRGYASSEARIASPYDPLYLEHYKPSSPNNETIIEYLDFSKSDSVDAVMQPWEVESGKHYEVVLTTSNGMWRYRLGDVVEIAGFDQNDGEPIIRFIERRSVAIRIAHTSIGEKELRAAMAFVIESTLGKVVDWTATLDERQLPRAIGVFVELADEQVCDASLSGTRLLDALSRSNETVSSAFAKGALGKPSIWIVERGTFSAFRQLKLDEGGNSIGQVKVPVVLPKPAHVNWFLGRVVKKL